MCQALLATYGMATCRRMESFSKFGAAMGAWGAPGDYRASSFFSQADRQSSVHVTRRWVHVPCELGCISEEVP